MRKVQKQSSPTTISINMTKPAADGFTAISHTMRIIIAVMTSRMVDRNHILSDRYFINDVQAVKMIFKQKELIIAITINRPFFYVLLSLQILTEIRLTSNYFPFFGVLNRYSCREHSSSQLCVEFRNLINRCYYYTGYKKEMADQGLGG